MGKIRKEFDSLKKKFGNKNTREKIGEDVKKRLRQAKVKIDWVEGQFKSKKNQAKIKAEFEKARKKLVVLKGRYKEKERRAIQYTKDNPKKALAMAAAAGALAGSLWATFRKK